MHMNFDTIIADIKEIDVVTATIYLTLIIPLIIALIYAF